MDTHLTFKTVNYCRFEPPAKNEQIIMTPEATTQVTRHLRDEFLKIEDGDQFGSELSFDHGAKIVVVCQRIGQTAALAAWHQPSGTQERLAVSILLSGLDKRDDTRAIESVRHVWGLPFSDSVYGGLWSQPRPILGTLFLSADGYGHPAIRGGVGCLAAAFSGLLGLMGHGGE